MSTKISQLTSATDITASDLMQIVDVEDGVMAPSGTNKKATAQLVANNLAKIINDGAVITANTSTDAVRITQTGSGNALVVEDSANPDSTPFVVDANGRVLSGYSTAQSPFAVTSRFQASSTDSEAGFSSFRYSADAQSGLIGFSKSRNASIGAQTIVQSGDELGTIRFAGSDGANFIQAASITAAVGGTPGTNDMPGRLSFSTTADGGTVPTERMRIDSAGNVGIGTISPTAKLNVVDNSANDAVRITQTGAGNALVVEDNTTPDSSPFVISNDGRVYIGNTINTTTPVGNPPLQVTTGQSIIRYSDNGLFGSVIDMCHSKSNIIGSNSSLANNDLTGVINFAGADGNSYIPSSSISSSVDGTPGTNDMPGRLVFSTTADGASTPTERMRITSAGDIGIGTSSPAQKLDVNGSIQCKDLLSITGIGTADASIGVGANRSASGNSYIDLVGDTVNTDYGARFLRASGENGATNIRHVGTGNFTIISEGAAPIRFWTNGSEKVLIESDGDVGIGTSTPSSKLHVAGDLTVSSATTATSATAGTNGDVPAQVVGYLVVNINGTARKIPYYA